MIFFDASESHMESKHIAERRVQQREPQLFHGVSVTRIIVSRHEAELIRLSSCAHAAKSSMPQAQRLQPIDGKYLRASHRHRQTDVNSTGFMIGIGGFMKAYAILWRKLHARSSEHAFDRANRLLVSRVATHLNIHDRVSMKTGRVTQVPNRPIERGPSDLVQLPRGRSCAHLTCDKVFHHVAKLKGGSSEL
jgi:hypothetical protein